MVLGSKIPQKKMQTISSHAHAPLSSNLLLGQSGVTVTVQQRSAHMLKIRRWKMNRHRYIRVKKKNRYVTHNLLFCWSCVQANPRASQTNVWLEMLYAYCWNIWPVFCSIKYEYVDPPEFQSLVTVLVSVPQVWEVLCDGGERPGCVILVNNPTEFIKNIATFCLLPFLTFIYQLQCIYLTLPV